MENSAVAIVGLSGRFPKADRVEDFWENLCQGKECITFYSETELLEAGVGPELLKDKSYVRAAAPIREPDLFDAPFFNYSPFEATLIDPQQRLFLECAAEALERSGCWQRNSTDVVGVFGSAAASKYVMDQARNGRGLTNGAGLLEVLIGNEKDFLASRVAYKLNLTGPSVTIQTACSSSLVAVHYACQSILSGECTAAIAGGVSLSNLSRQGYLYQREGILSQDGHCRSYDARASGAVAGDGVGVVVLKDLESAVRDRNLIYAVIKGSAVNNDGADRLGYTAPSIQGQAAVISEALQIAGVSAESISYIEGHGSGTALGDSVEIRALTQAFRRQTARTRFCAIGSVKTNIGHLNTAAGVAGLIKVALALHHKQLPPSLHFQQANPEIDFDSSPFFVNTALREWGNGPVPVRAGVSSFGLGGTNAHVILEEYRESTPARIAPPAVRSARLFLLSAKTQTALSQIGRNLAEHLKVDGAANLADVEFTLAVGRKFHDFRRVAICSDRAEAISALADLHSQNSYHHRVGGEVPSVAFLCSGLGDQHSGMSGDLYALHPVFRKTIDSCLKLLPVAIRLPVRLLLLGRKKPAGETAKLNLRRIMDARGKAGKTDAADDIVVAHPALFILEMALAELWKHWGALPVCLVGYSLGEYVAACLAGVFSVEDALRLVVARARLLSALPPGGMLVVSLPEGPLREWLTEETAISAWLSPESVVVSGTVEGIDRLHRELHEREIFCQRLSTRLAFHSEWMAPAAERFAEVVNQLDLQPPKIPYLSNVTGTWITDGQATDPAYWTQQIRRPVQFEQCLSELFRADQQVLIEIGPGASLNPFAMQHPGKTARHVILNSLPHAGDQRPASEIILASLGRLWLTGVTVDWDAFHSRSRGRQIPLPAYPFERHRYWMGHPASRPSGPASPEPAAGTNRESHLLVPVWKRVVPNSARQGETRRRLVCSTADAASDAIVEELKARGEMTVVVMAGEYRRLNETLFSLNPAREADFVRLLETLRSEGRLPDEIINLWPLQRARSGAIEDFNCLVFLARAIANTRSLDAVHLVCVSANAFEVIGNETISPEASLVIGPLRVIPQEYPMIRCSHLDLAIPDAQSIPRDVLSCASKVIASGAPPRGAIRGPYLWEQEFVPCDPDVDPKLPRLLRHQGTYLISGGLGGIGLETAQHLASLGIQPRLILTGRGTFPPESEWSACLVDRPRQREICRKIELLQQLQAAGAQLFVIQADAGSHEQMTAAVTAAEQRFGGIHGIFHCAGVPGAGMIHTKSGAAVDEVFRSKLDGSRVLEAVFREKPIDFLVLCSSLTSITGGIGQVDYCSANAYLDGFAAYFSKAYGRPALSVSWDRWADVGMGKLPGPGETLAGEPVRHSILKTRKDWNGNVQFDAELRGRPTGSGDALTAEEGRALLGKVLSAAGSSHFLATRRTVEEIRESAASVPSKLASDLALPEPEFWKPRPDLMSAYVAAQDDGERRVTEIWQRILGVKQIGAMDNFFDLGGNSLLGIRVLVELNKKFGKALSIATIYEMPTVRGLARFLKEPENQPSEIEESIQRAKNRVQRTSRQLGRSRAR